MKKLKLIKNSALCKLCNTEIESKYRHDFVTCNCGNISVDGGTVYRRMLLRDKEDSFEDTCIYEEITE